MVHIELYPDQITDPLVTPISEAEDGSSRNTFYVHQNSSEVTLTAERRTLPKGGIL